MPSLRTTATIATTLALAFGAAPGEAARTEPEVSLEFDGGQKTGGDRLRSFANTGTASVDTSVAGAGVVTRVRGHEDWAVALPAVSEPDAVIRVANAGKRDRLQPGTNRFRFGASFRLDADSTGAGDDGDNIVQRGLWGDRAQFKLQVDRRTPMCSVKGASRVSVSSPVNVVPGDWYRVTCLRGADFVKLSVRHYNADGTVDRRVTRREGATGRLDFPFRTPLSIGGKLRTDGSLSPSADQFNGVIDSVFLTIL